jgi:hypothetical protein
MHVVLGVLVAALLIYLVYRAVSAPATSPDLFGKVVATAG